MDIECLEGTFSAEAWHIGKHVAADPSGFNWRIDCDDVDVALRGLAAQGQIIFTGPRLLVRVDNLPDKVIIHAYDTAMPEHNGCRAVLSTEGRKQFYAVLESVRERDCLPSRKE